MDGTKSGLEKRGQSTQYWVIHDNNKYAKQCVYVWIGGYDLYVYIYMHVCVYECDLYAIFN